MVLILLQETLQYIESQHKLSVAHNLITIASQGKFKQIRNKISREIVAILYNKIEPEGPVNCVKNEPNTECCTAKNQEQSTVTVIKQVNESNALVAYEQKSRKETNQHNGCGTGEKEKDTLTSGIIIKSEIQDIDSFPLSNITKSITSQNNSTNENQLKENSKQITTKPTSESRNLFALFDVNAEYIKEEITESNTVEEIRENKTNDPQFNAETDGAIYCKVCNMKFYKLADLASHCKTHTAKELGLFKCPVCDKSLAAKSSLKTHVLIHTGEKPFVCKICNKPFRQTSDLNKHTLVHTKEKLFNCEVCEKWFGDKASLKKHMLLHTNVRPYKCKMCDQRFRRSQHLALHVLIHTGEKPFKCNICNKRFARDQYLKYHIRSHTGEKPYVCDVCGKRCTQPTHLRNHKSTHLKPYKCELCERAFHQPRYLRIHIRDTHGKKEDLQCKFCQKEFMSRRYLLQHVKKIHETVKLAPQKF